MPLRNDNVQTASFHYQKSLIPLYNQVYTNLSLETSLNHCFILLFALKIFFVNKKEGV